LQNTGIFKIITGEDPITTEKKFKDYFSFTSFAKQIFSCNQLPKAYDDTRAYYSRWIILNFPNCFEGEKADKNLIKKLVTKDELSGLFNWALEGLCRLIDKGEFSWDLDTDKARELYVRLSDSVESFIMDCVQISPSEYIEKKTLYTGFCEYCRGKGYPIIDERLFHKGLQQKLRIEDYRPRVAGNRVCCWRGIKLVEESVYSWSAWSTWSDEKDYLSCGKTISKNKIEKTVDQTDHPDHLTENPQKIVPNMLNLADLKPINENFEENIEKVREMTEFEILVTIKDKVSRKQDFSASELCKRFGASYEAYIDNLISKFKQEGIIYEPKPDVLKPL
jgi:putative DNA primase/helicase